MAISIVDTPQTGAAISGGNVTLTFSTTPNENDIVLVVGGAGAFRTPNPAAPGTGYTQIALNASNIFMGAWYKRMGASPDANVLCRGSGNSADATAYVAYVLRGVDTSTALDVAATTAGETTAVNPNAPSITTTTNASWVFACAGSRVNDATIIAPSGYSNHFTVAQTDTNAFTVAACSLEKTTAGAEDPPAWSNWNSGIYFAISLALRPAGAGWANITKVNGVASTSLSKVNDIAVASISKVNGISV